MEIKEQLIESLEQQLHMHNMLHHNPFAKIPMVYFEYAWGKHWMHIKGFADLEEGLDLPAIWSLAYIEILMIQSLP